MTESEINAFYHQYDSDVQPIEAEPAELLDADWANAGNED